VLPETRKTGVLTDALTEPKTPPESGAPKTLPPDPLAADLIQMFVEAAANKTEITRRMHEAYWAAQEMYSPEAKCKLENPDEIYVGLFAQQLSTYMAWVVDRIAQGTTFFTLEPTPVPNVPQHFRALAVQKVMRELNVLDYLPTDEARRYARTRIADLKAEINTALFEEAKRATIGMERAMNDIMVEGGFVQAYLQFHRDLFCSLGVMKFPVFSFEKTVDWTNGGKPTVRRVQKMRWGRVSPMDFYWSADSTTAQDGRYVCEHSRLPREALEWMRDNAPEGVLRLAADYILEQVPNGTPWLQGCLAAENEAALENGALSAHLSAHVPGTYDCLIVHTRLPGDVLIAYGVTEFVVAGRKGVVSASETYEIEAWVVENLVCYLAVNPDPMGRRPYWTASYEPVNGQLMGVSAWDKIRSYEIAYRNVHRHLLRFVAFESSFIAEIDVGRFVSSSRPMEIVPWMALPVDADYTGGGQRALHLHNLARGSADIRAYLQMISEQAQHATGIYNTMAGSTAYGTVARTRFGVESVQANATKIVFAKAEYTDKYAMEPMFKALYDYLMIYGSDNSIKVDAQVVVRGITSVSTREAQVRRAIELLQYLPAMIQVDQQTGAQSVPAPVVQSLFRRIIEGLGGDVRSLPDPDAARTVAQAIGLEPPGGPDPEVRAALQAELPEAAVRVPPT
jgi:hypothetical protein